ncbi:MAG TPA: cytochrome-c peroxidase [Chitinophagaceae bacterium]|nr:cytochrome-c peroxidase [Chitinophagaceae bacterium]HNM34018.1 cytochrome-c peroxidase [Chitinophagaceae bacterium]
MKTFKVITILICLVVVGVGFIEIKKHKPTPLIFIVPKGWPKPIYNFKNNPLTVEGFELGKKLFYDERLSKDSTISCASCHQQFSAFATFDHNFSHGYNNTFTTRNAPALQNLAWQKELMWDGGINHLDVQPITPIVAENEMAETLENVIYKLKKDTSYKRMFKNAFGSNEITTERMTKALSQFMVMLVSSNSKYDKVKRGEDTFNLPEKLGYEIFKQKCASCHTEPFFTDLSYRNTGMPLDATINDIGRMRITNNKNDSLKFKVPSLRNVDLTFPYGHDGRFFTLSNVFEHYRSNMQPIHNTDILLKNKLYLSNFQIGQLTAFLFSLTDSSFTKNPLFAAPAYTKPIILHQH